MFNREEIEKLEAEKENLQSQLELKSLENKQLQEQLEHKRNEVLDLVSQVFLSFKRITEIAERNDYGMPEQKVRQIKEFATQQRNYYAQLTIDTPIGIKNRTNITDQSNK